MSNETKKYAGLGTLQAFLDGCRTIFANITHKHTMSDITDSSTVLETYETKVDAQSKYDTITEAKANWNQNDESAIDYIKNRPFYETEKEVFLLPEMDVNIDDNMYAQVSNSLVFKEGATYTVTFNGVQYECESWTDGEGAFYIGNGSIYGGDGKGNDVPFSFDSYGDGSCFLNTETTGTYCISIFGMGYETHQLDEKYIPDSIKAKVGKQMPNGTYEYYTSVTGEIVEVVIDEVNKGGEVFNEYSFECNMALGEYSHAEGYYSKAIGRGSHSEGSGTAIADWSHAEGSGSEASGIYSHAEGRYTLASGEASHAEGHNSEASGIYSHAEGLSTIASSYWSHAEGVMTIAASESQHVEGKYNIKDTENKYAHIVGNGNSDENRSNAHTLDWDGNAWYAGTIKVGGTSYDDASEVALKSDLESIDLSEYATTIYVDSTFAKKSDVQDVDLSNYYTKSETENVELISVSDIDTICSATIQVASASATSEVTF